MNCTSWRADFENFENMLDNLNPSNFCIIGDLNCRIGVEQVLDINEVVNLKNIYHHRNSKDKVVNWQGKRLLEAVENIGGIVLNGRCSDDVEGNFSFCGVMGNSVIDYCIGSNSFIQYVDYFSIGSKPYSDHMPLLVHLKIPKTQSNLCSPTLSKLYWSEKNVEQYRQNLSFVSQIQPFQPNSTVDELIDTLAKKITSSNVTNSNKKIFSPKQKWFDWKCFRLRSSMSKDLKEFRNNHTHINKFRYLESRSRYLSVCNQKKLEFQNNLLINLDNVRSSKDWWHTANSLKTRPPSSGNEICAATLYNHFSSLLSVDIDQSIHWCMPCVVDSFLDSPFEACELFSVLKSLKLNKSPGLDGIPYEFYKFAPVCFMNEILHVFNKIF